MKYKNTAFFLACFFFLIGCENSEKKMYTKIKSTLKDNQGVSKEEFADIKSFIQRDPELSQTYFNDDLIKTLIIKFSNEICASGRSSISCPVKIDCGDENKPEKLIFDFFYENSASMDGYISSKSNFSDAVLSMITQAKLDSHRVNMYYVNNGVYPLNDKISTFETFLKPESTRKYGERGNSEINRILSTVVDSALSAPNRVTVLISDYIYSMKGKMVSEELDVLKSTTALVINRLADKNYATLIVKINSKFKGVFYSNDNTALDILEDRPAYFWIFCRKDIIPKVIDDFKINELSGYEKHFILQNDDKLNTYFSALKYTNREGRFEKQDRGVKEIKSICSVVPDRNGNVSIGIAVDLSKVAVMDEEKVNLSNYEVVSTADNNFAINKIEGIKSLHQNDKELQGSATHIITLTLNEKLKKGEQKVSINFKKLIPGWVKESSTDDDRNYEGRANKTFGLEALIKGAAKAYDYSDKHTRLSATLTIKN